MRFSVRLIFFILTVQALLTAGHYALYQALLFFFPGLLDYRPVILALMLLLSVSFLLSSWLEISDGSKLVRWLYIISAVWTPTWMYLMFAAALAALFSRIRPDWATPVGAGMLLLALCYSAYGVINARRLRVVRLDVALPNLPGQWRGRRAVLASDLHLGHILRQGFAAKLTKRINSLNPDAIFIAGDAFDGFHSDFKGLARPLRDLRSPLGVFFCSGNHELYAGMEECQQALREAGVTVLQDSMVEVDGLQVAGLSYERERLPDMQGKLRGLGLDRNRASVLLKHVPLQNDLAAQAGIGLQLSGHTHRGQVWPGSLITKRYYRGLDYGYHRLGEMQMFVSSGAGTWGPPVRTGSNSEIVLINFL